MGLEVQRGRRAGAARGRQGLRRGVKRSGAEERMGKHVWLAFVLECEDEGTIAVDGETEEAAKLEAAKFWVAPPEQIGLIPVTASFVNKVTARVEELEAALHGLYRTAKALVIESPDAIRATRRSGKAA